MRVILILLSGLIAVLGSATRSRGQSVGKDFFEISSIDSDIATDHLNARSLLAEKRFRPRYDRDDDAHYVSQPSLQLDFPVPKSSRNPFGEATEPLREFGENLIADQQSFYSPDHLKFLAGMFLIGGAVANTPFDESLRERLHDNLVYTPSDEYAEYFRMHSFLGDGYILLPAYAAISITGKHILDNPTAFVVGEWSERSLRGIFVGAPPLLITQLATGGSRPNEQAHRSDWRPFSDDNGVSGHAFMGAVPFLTAAKMSENRWWKGTFIAASLVPGMSRITDDAHYPSQVFLGWTLAWVATSAVDDTQIAGHTLSFEPTNIDGSAGLGFSIRR